MLNTLTWLGNILGYRTIFKYNTWRVAYTSNSLFVNSIPSKFEQGKLNYNTIFFRLKYTYSGTCLNHEESVLLYNIPFP